MKPEFVIFVEQEANHNWVGRFERHETLAQWRKWLGSVGFAPIHIGSLLELPCKSVTFAVSVLYAGAAHLTERQAWRTRRSLFEPESSWLTGFFTQHIHIYLGLELLLLVPIAQIETSTTKRLKSYMILGLRGCLWDLHVHLSIMDPESPMVLII